PRAEISRAGPVELGDVAFPVAVRDDRRMDTGLRSTPCPQESAAFRREEPLVTVAGIPVRAECGDIERELPRHVRAVHQNARAARAGESREALHGKDEPGRRRDVIEHDESRTPAELALDRADESRFVSDWQRDARFDEPRAGAPADFSQGLAHGI